MLTTKPALLLPSFERSTCNTKRRRPARTPPRITARNSSLRRRRASAGSTPRPVVAGWHVIRRRAGYGPCDGGPPGWRGPRASASGAGTHESARDDGCSAGRCACPCSRQSFSWSCGDRSSVCHRDEAAPLAPGTHKVGRPKGAAVSGRPYEGTHRPPGLRHRPLSRECPARLRPLNDLGTRGRNTPAADLDSSSFVVPRDRGSGEDAGTKGMTRLPKFRDTVPERHSAGELCGQPRPRRRDTQCHPFAEHGWRHAEARDFLAVAHALWHRVRLVSVPLLGLRRPPGALDRRRGSS